MMATGNVPDVDMPPLADAGAVEAHDQEGGEEEEPAIDECIDLEEEASPGLSPDSKALLILSNSMNEEPRPDNKFGSPFALQ